VLRGTFSPTAAYARLRPLFRAEALWHALAEDASGERLLAAAGRARAALRFALRDERGTPLDVAHLHVGEPDGADGRLEVTAFLSAPAARPARGLTPGLALRWVRRGRDGSEGVVDTLDSPGLDPRLTALGPPGGACLRFVDRAGRTVFNRLQVPQFAREVRHARDRAAPDLRRSAEGVLRFLGRAVAAGCELWIEPGGWTG
jgi:hypothetical protein